MMPLFHVTADNQVRRLRPGQFELERQLHDLIEGNLLDIFGVRFIASEFDMQGSQAGRIDTLGLDLDGAPTIVEYKRDSSQSVINQGLYYMDWLIEHRGDFEIAAQKAVGYDLEINWSHPRLIVVAQTFAKWDTPAVKRMGGGIELWKYVLYGDDLIHLEMVYGQQRTVHIPQPEPEDKAIELEPEYTLEYHLDGKSELIHALFYSLRDGILGFSSEEGEIIETPNKIYIGYRHGRNFCEVTVQARSLRLFIDIPHDELHDPEGIARDVSNVGHWGTGETEVRLSDQSTLEYILGLIEQSYRRTL